MRWTWFFQDLDYGRHAVSNRACRASDTAFRRRVDAVRQNALAQHQHTSKPSRRRGATTQQSQGDVCNQEKISQKEQRGVAVSQDQLPVPRWLLCLRAPRLRGLLAPAIKHTSRPRGGSTAPSSKQRNKK